MKIRLIALVITSLLPNRLKVFIYRHFLGANIGANVSIGIFALIDSQNIVINENSTIGHFTHIYAHSVKIGKYATVGNFAQIEVNNFVMGNRATISSFVEIEGDKSDVNSRYAMGMYSWVFKYCHVNVIRPVTLGINVGIGGRSCIFTHGYWLPGTEGYPVDYNEVSIGNDVWIPWGCFIMPGVKIGNRVIVGARSLINKDIPDGALFAGIPAKMIKEKSSREITILEKIDIIDGLIKLFCERENCDLKVSVVDGDTMYLTNGIPGFVLHTRTSERINDCYRSALHIFLIAFSDDKISNYCWYSLKDYKCSNYSNFDSQMKKWLTFIRRAGLRFYPCDELDDKSV